ncbi:MAG TPA: alpha/beta hydrolase [Nitrospira sp.]|nr:alpha/beta hydrolase [Nitrospira sp.]
MAHSSDDEHPFSFLRVHANQLEFKVATAGSGDQLVLLLHGFPESSLSWRHQMAPLAQAGYRVWAPDLRGYGGTARPDGLDAYHLEPLLEDVAALIDISKASQVILVGHDWGGIIAWYYAMRRPERLAALIVLNAPHPACFERELRHWRQLRRSWYMAAFQIPWLPETVLAASGARLIGTIFEHMRVNSEYLPNDIVRRYRHQACEPGTLTAMVNYYRAAIRGRGAARQRALGYPAINLPTLVIWGLQDHALAQQNLDGLDRFATDLTVLTLEQSGHFVHQDEPRRVTDEILGWLHRQSFHKV